MITLAELHRKALHQYKTVLQAYLTGQELFTPMVIPSDKSLDKRAGVDVSYEQQRELIEQSKNKTGRGYALELKLNAKTGQSEIRKITFETLNDFLFFISKEREYQAFVQDVERVRYVSPALLPLFEKLPLLVVKQAGNWSNLLQVTAYFEQNPKPQQYVRSLPLDLPTKFIEDNRTILRTLLDHLIPDHINASESDFYKRFHLNIEEPLVKIRFLDESLQFHPALSHVSVWLSEFRDLALPGSRVFIIENLTTFLTFPSMPNSFAIWGGGFAVTLLGGIDWLAAKQLYYWGDIDVHGFQILSKIRTCYPKIQSLLMDKATFWQYQTDKRGGNFNALILINLNDEEEEIYNMLLAENWRVEQEKIDKEWLNKVLLK